MANIKSAKKRMIQSRKRRLRNKINVSELRTEIKKLLMLLKTSKDIELLLGQLRKVEKIADKIASKGIIHKNKAARTKSRLTRRYNQVLDTIQANTSSTESEASMHSSTSIDAAV